LKNSQPEGENNNDQKKQKHIVPADRQLDDGIGINVGDGCLAA
jgi:hypothetical protein